MTSSGVKNLIVLLLYAVVDFIIFGGSLNNYFMSDDFLLLDYASSGELSDIFISDTHYFRPVRMIIYSLLWNISGLNPFAYMLFDLIIHIFTVYFLYKLTLELIPENKNKFIISSLAGLLFSVHFIHSEAVLSISSTSELLFSMLYLIGLIFYIRYKRSEQRKFLYYLFPIFILGFFTKETFISILLTITAFDIFYFRFNFIRIIKDNLILYLIGIVLVIIKVIQSPGISSISSQPIFILFFEGVKNILFGFISFFFSLDFFGIKEIIKPLLPDIISGFKLLVQSKPVDTVLIFIAVIIVAYIFIKGDRFVRSMILFSLITIAPFMFIAGYERYMYLPSAALSIMLIYFLFENTKLKNNLIYFLIAFFLVYNIYWLIQKKNIWDTASGISRASVNEIVEKGSVLPQNSKAYFIGLPDHYKGAWIFREGLVYIPDLIMNRPDLYFQIYLRDDFNPPPHTNYKENIYIFNYSNGALELVN
jgi:hypothetical protein